jgi:hypothetical protein
MQSDDSLGVQKNACGALWNLAINGVAYVSVFVTERYLKKTTGHWLLNWVVLPKFFKRCKHTRIMKECSSMVPQLCGICHWMVCSYMSSVISTNMFIQMKTKHRSFKEVSHECEVNVLIECRWSETIAVCYGFSKAQLGYSRTWLQILLVSSERW